MGPKAEGSVDSPGREPRTTLWPSSHLQHKVDWPAGKLRAKGAQQQALRSPPASFHRATQSPPPTPARHLCRRSKDHESSPGGHTEHSSDHLHGCLLVLV